VKGEKKGEGQLASHTLFTSWGKGKERGWRREGKVGRHSSKCKVTTTPLY